ILQRERAARLVQFATMSPRQLTLGEAIDSLVAFTWNRPAPADRKLAALQRVTQRAVADRLLELAADTTAAPLVRGIAELKLRGLRTTADARARRSGSDMERAHWLALANDLAGW